MTLSGRFAWLLWVFADIYFLIGFRSRIVVALDWLWAYVTFRRGARIVLAETGGAGWRSRGQCPDACNGRRGDQIMSTYDLVIIGSGAAAQAQARACVALGGRWRWSITVPSAGLAHCAAAIQRRCRSVALRRSTRRPACAGLVLWATRTD